MNLLLPNRLLSDHSFTWSGFVRDRNPTPIPQCLEASVGKWGAIWRGFPESSGIPVEGSRGRDRGCG